MKLAVIVISAVLISLGVIITTFAAYQIGHVNGQEISCQPHTQEEQYI